MSIASIVASQQPGPHVLAKVRGWIASYARFEPVLFALAMLLVLAIAPTLFASAIDARTVSAENPWIKPLRFELALAAYLFTLVLYARWLPRRATDVRGYRIFRNTVVVAIAAEMIWVAGAAYLGTISHFNPTLPGSILYAVMGVLAVILTSITALYARLIASNRTTGLPPVMKEAIVIGLALTLPLTLISAGPLAASGTPALPLPGSAAEDTFSLFSWLRQGGGLRLAHFLGSHALHALPIAGLASWLVFGRDTRLPLRLVAALYAALVAGVVLLSLDGRPISDLLG